MISRIMTASAAALCALAFVSVSASGARAGGFCSTDSSGIRGCGYDTLAQCQASVAGKYGSCAPDPFQSANKLNPNNALAEAPKGHRTTVMRVRH